MEKSNLSASGKAAILKAANDYYIPGNIYNQKRSIWDILWRKFVQKLFRNPKLWVDKFDVVESTLPRDVGAEIINTCNARCSFCGYAKGENGKAADYRVKEKLDREAYTHTLKLYSDSGGGILALSPILGEVSAHPDWLVMVREAISFPNITGVTCFTNAILLDRFGAEEILKSGITSINISTSLGSDEQYQRLYGVNKYEKVLENIFDLLKTNARLGNLVDISLFLRIDKPYSRFFDSKLYTEITAYIDPQKIEILHDEWDNWRGIIPQEGLPHGQNFKKLQADKYVPCYAMYRKLQVMLDGTLQSCSCRVEPELWGGNIKNYDTMEEAWKDPGIERLRNNWHSGEVPGCCQECSHYQPYTQLIHKTAPGEVFPRLFQALRRRMRFQDTSCDLTTNK
jgi:radical SAM protein with 4Fe4S-binding SPASM domain